MDARERRRKLREGLKESQEDSYKRRDQSGKFKPIFREDIVSPDRMWKCKEDKHEMNIVPFIAGKNHPHVRAGKSAHMLDVWVHPKIGPNENSYICVKMTFEDKDLRCAFCEEQTRLDNEGAPEDVVKALQPKHRVFYNIECLDSRSEKEKGIQIWDAPYNKFERLLIEKAEDKPGGRVLFSDVDDGKIVAFKRKGMGPTNTEFINFDFLDRSEPISDRLIEQTICLDEAMIILTYEEAYKAMFGTDYKGAPPDRDSRTSKESDVPGDLGSEDCPHGYKFGDDFRLYDKCEKCENFDPCADKYDAIVDEEEARKKEEEEEARRREEEEKKKAEEEARKKEEDSRSRGRDRDRDRGGRDRDRDRDRGSSTTSSDNRGRSRRVER